ncbi:echinoderm microtubule-associated protein-like CG42247 isoform X3 [Mizuhopecten yessoensis]|uniref:echinoderm microtubule-associated protein-like CG42247 isoform X3 n=1 Tax=Mizuhopecten yessoensis TaxID=6573 RepID=UPI000B45D2DE|nr:echinoderm microtubule-associated protein-like CG42247 isoform X3 [Mizuhopecten yessoensis]
MEGYDRIPAFVSGGLDTYRRDRFYSEKQKYKQLLASHERKKERYKRRDKHAKHKQFGRPDDIVRTGSEEENETHVRQRRNTRKRSMRKRDDELMASIERRERILRIHMDRMNQHYLSPTDTKVPSEYSYRSSFQQESNDYPSYTRTQMAETGRPLYRYMEPVNRPPQYPVEPEQRPLHAGQSELPVIPTKPKYYTHIPLPENVESERQPVLENEREDARHKRASVLNRVEKLLNDMDRQMNGGEIILKSKAKRSRKKFIKKKEDTDSGDDSYVFVKTTVTPTPPPYSESHSDVDVSLPSLPASSLGPQIVSRMSFPSGVKSEIQYAYSDEEADGQPDPRPFTDSYRGHPFTLGGAARYEQRKNGTGSVKTVPAIQPGKRKENGVRANLVTFYINGDRNYKGLTIAVSGKKWLNIDKLKEHLTQKIGTHWPVKCIFTIPDRQLIDDLDKFENNRSYIVCKDKNAQVNGIHYGYSKEKHWVTKRPSAGKIRKHDLGMLKQNAPANSPSKNRRVITIIQNKNRVRKEKVILNPETPMSFDQILSDMGDMINMNATALYLYKKPETRVTSYSQLFREYKTVDEFIICGEELSPASEASDVQEYEDYSVDIDQSGYLDTEESNGWDNPLEEVSFDNTLDNDEDSAKRVKVRIRGKYKEYFQPEKPAPDDRSRPNEKLILEWLYGYRSNDNSTSLMLYHRTGELVCYMDAAVVFYNRTFDHQRFYLAHTEEITCMAIHPEGRWIATGQKAGSGPEDVAHIRIWDGRTLSTQVILGVGIFSCGVSAVNFSVYRDGVLLCAVESSEKHVLTVWEWNRKRLLAKTTTTSRYVSHACFYPFDDTILITYGDQHLYFWKLFWDPVRDTDGRLLRDKDSGTFVTEDSREITSIAFPPNGDVVTGDTTGSVIVWAVDRATLVFRFLTVLPDRHHRAVNSLCLLPDSTLISGGGKEFKAWNTNNNHYRKTRERLLADGVGDVASIVLKDKSMPEGGKPVFYIGTTNSCLLEGSFEDKLKKHIEGHCDTVSSVVSHPRENSFFSASMDRTVKKWSADKHKLLYTRNVEKPCSCIDIDRKGRYLTIGTADGFVIVLAASLKEEIAIIKVGSTPELIECVKISPERDTLAVGCHDGCVYIYNDVNDGAKIAIRNNTIFKANPAPVINVDWTTNSHNIQTMSSEYDHFHWDVTDMVASKAITFRDAEWQTQNVTVGYPVFGMWTNLKDEDEVRVMDRSRSNTTIAAGDGKGGIRLYKYPCTSIKPEFKMTRMYSNEVTALSFLARTDRLISCGGQKSVLAQWKVEKYITANEH